MNASIQRLSICGVPVDRITVDQLIERFVEWSNPEAPARYICYVNAHVHNLARQDFELKSVLSDSALCYADGASIVWASRVYGAALPNRMTAADFSPALLRQMANHQRRVFLLGGKPGVADATANALARDVNGFITTGTAHGYFSPCESSDVVAAINAADPDLLIVGMGSPRQEKWIAEHRDALNVPLIWAVGALLDYRAGKERRCPHWMGNHGLEWLFRLAMNPRRMASRYLLGNPTFVCSILLSRFRNRTST